MATDIVERLREQARTIFVASDSATMREAADEIERLRAALKEIADHDSIDDYGHALIAQTALGKAWKP